MNVTGNCEDISAKSVPAKEAESKWQQIETAPTSTADDPEVVMLWVADGGHRGTGCHAFGRCYRQSDGSVKGMATGYYGNWRVTHWQPLPAPPVQS